MHFSKSLRFCYLNICKSYCKTFFYAIINIIVYEIYVFVFSVLKRAGECQIERLRHAYVLILPLLFCSAVSSFCFVFPPTFFFFAFLLFAGFHLSARCCTVAVIFVVVFIS